MTIPGQLDGGDLGRCFGVFKVSAFRLETLRSYAVPGEDERLRAFRLGLALPERSARTSAWLRRIAGTTAAGKSWRRVRVLGRPLSEYECYQLIGYRESAQAGEVIRIADRSARPELAALARDFWLFDVGTARPFAAVMNYDRCRRVPRRRGDGRASGDHGMRDRPQPCPAVLGAAGGLPGPAEGQRTVTSGLPGEPRAQRGQLGAELRRVRMLAGLSGRQLARAAGLSQSAVSRAERGESVLSLPEVTAWADAAGVSGDRRAVLLALAEAAVNEVATFRLRLRGGLAAAQESVGDLEASARVVRNFQPGIIPGLLQTADYARRIMALADTGHDGGLAAAVAARLARQQALHDPARSFEFVMTEAALRYRPGAPDILAIPDGCPPRPSPSRRSPASSTTWRPSSRRRRSPSA